MAFRDLEPEWNADHRVRTLRRVDVHRGDVSVVSYGASPATSLALRHVKGMKGEFEERRVPIVVRDSGCNRCDGDGVITITCPNCGGGDPGAGVEANAARRPSPARRRAPRRPVVAPTVAEMRAWLAAERARDDDAQAAHDRWIARELARLRRSR